MYWLWAINAVEKGCPRTFSMRKPVCTPLAEREKTETINADGSERTRKAAWRPEVEPLVELASLSLDMAHKHDPA